MLLALAPVLIGWWYGQHHGEPLVLLLALLVGLLVAAAPLAWVSIAACFIYPPILLDGHSGLSAQHLSFRLVKGHWTMAAVLVSLATLAFWGLLGVVATFPLLLTGMIAFAMDGLQALLRPGWLVWGQVLCAPLMALLMPLATAGYWVAYEELRLRRAVKNSDGAASICLQFRIGRLSEAMPDIGVSAWRSLVDAHQGGFPDQVRGHRQPMNDPVVQKFRGGRCSHQPLSSTMPCARQASRKPERKNR